MELSNLNYSKQHLQLDIPQLAMYVATLNVQTEEEGRGWRSYTFLELAKF